MRPSTELRNALYILNAYYNGLCGEEDVINTVSELGNGDRQNFCNMCPMFFGGKFGQKVNILCEMAR